MPPIFHVGPPPNPNKMQPTTTPTTTPTVASQKTITRSYLQSLYEANKQNAIAEYVRTIIPTIERRATIGNKSYSTTVYNNLIVNEYKITVEDLLAALRITFPDCSVEQHEENKACIIIDWS